MEKSHAEMTLGERLDWCQLPDEEKYRRAVPPLKIVSDKGTYKKSRNRTSFDVREYDSLGRELDSSTVRNQRETAVEEGRAKHFYVWSCTCGQENCRHVMVAKRIYWAEWRKKKNAEEWLLKNDPTYVTAKMAAEGYVNWHMSPAMVAAGKEVEERCAKKP